MTDRVHSITLVLAEDTRIDDARQLIAAAGMLSGVAAVQPNVSDPQSFVAHARAHVRISEALFKALREVAP